MVIDNFTKYVELFATSDMEEVGTALQVFGRFRNIRRIRSDQGSQFMGDVCSGLIELVGTKQVLNSWI